MMSKPESTITVLKVQKDFQKSSNEASKAKPKKSGSAPFSMRLSEEERQFLIEHCGNQSWAGYIRQRVFSDHGKKRKTIRRPNIANQEIATSLSGLGQSRLSSNLNQLAKHANMGTLDVDTETERQLQEAYEAIIAMRNALFVALGLEPPADS